MERRAEPQRQTPDVAAPPFGGFDKRHFRREPMLAFHIFGAKEIAVYVVVVVLVVIVIVWSLMRRRTKV
jgi:hypothetical protein